jgi:hypothetical protein
MGYIKQPKTRQILYHECITASVDGLCLLLHQGVEPDYLVPEVLLLFRNRLITGKHDT